MSPELQYKLYSCVIANICLMARMCPVANHSTVGEQRAQRITIDSSLKLNDMSPGYRYTTESITILQICPATQHQTYATNRILRRESRICQSRICSAAHHRHGNARRGRSPGDDMIIAGRRGEESYRAELRRHVHASSSQRLSRRGSAVQDACR